MILDTLTHITDVGTQAGDGVDSNERIVKQYQRLRVAYPRVVTAGQSPLHVAFAACTDIAEESKLKILKVLDLLKKKPTIPFPTALNCAPRNGSESCSHAQEDHIYRIRFEDLRFETQLLYGSEVLRWILDFRDGLLRVVEKIFSVKGIIPDTSKGSQFRSAEYLPIVHVLETFGKLDDLSERQEVAPRSDIPPIFSRDKRLNHLVVAPPDEYANGRLIVGRAQIERILGKEQIEIPEITDRSLVVRKSLTEVIPGQLSVWPSSNHIPGGTLGVLNIGTRWNEGRTKTTNTSVIALAKKLSCNVGKSCLFNLR